MRNVFLRSQLEIDWDSDQDTCVPAIQRDFSLCKEGIGKHLIPENCGEKKNNTLILTASKITYCSCCVRGCTHPRTGRTNSSDPYLDFAQIKAKHLFLCSPTTQGARKPRTVSVKHIVTVRLHLAWLCWPGSLLRGRVWSMVPCFSPIFF